MLDFLKTLNYQKYCNLLFQQQNIYVDFKEQILVN